MSLSILNYIQGIIGAVMENPVHYVPKLLLLLLVLIVLWCRVLSDTRLFKKAGISAGHAWVPLLAEYDLFRMCWDTAWFKLTLALAAAYIVLYQFVNPEYFAFPFIVYFVVVRVLLYMKLARAFGEDLLRGVLIAILRPVFIFRLTGPDIAYGGNHSL